MTSKPYLDIQITPIRLLTAIFIALIVIFGIYIINSQWGLAKIEGFETLCEQIAKQESQEEPPEIIEVTKELSKAKLDKLNKLIKSSAKASNPTKSINEVQTEEIDISPCNMLTVPLKLTPDQTDVAISLERELAATVLPANKDDRDKLYNSIRTAIKENNNIPEVFKQYEISDTDARAIALTMAIQKTNNIANNENNIIAQNLIIGKAEADKPGRGLLMELATKTIPLEVNKAIKNNGGKDISPEVIALFSAEFQNSLNLESLDKLKYDKHRDLFCSNSLE